MTRALLEGYGRAKRSCVNSQGALHMWTLGDGIFCTRGHGHVGMAAVEALIDYTEQRIVEQSAKLLVFHDWLEVTGYESKARLPLSRWMFEHRASYEVVHVAVRSRLVAMGASVVNLAIGGFLKTHPTVRDVDVEMRRVLGRSGMESRLKIARELLVVAHCSSRPHQ